jgi:hypothetical protein
VKAEAIGKAYSLDKRTWFYTRLMFVTRLKIDRGTDNVEDLIGTKYFEGDRFLVPIEEAYGIVDIMNYFRSSSFFAGFGFEADPSLSEKDEAELQKLIVSFLEERSPRKLWRVGNVIEKVATREFVV